MLGLREQFDLYMGNVEVTEEEFEQILDRVCQRIDEISVKSHVGGLKRSQQRADVAKHMGAAAKAGQQLAQKQAGGAGGTDKLPKGSAPGSERQPGHVTQDQQAGAAGAAPGAAAGAEQPQPAASQQDAAKIQKGILNAVTKSPAIQKQVIQMIKVALKNAKTKAKAAKKAGVAEPKAPVEIGAGAHEEVGL